MDAPSFLFFAASEKLNEASEKIFAQASQIFKWMEIPVQGSRGKHSRSGEFSTNENWLSFQTLFVMVWLEKNVVFESLGKAVLSSAETISANNSLLFAKSIASRLWPHNGFAESKIIHYLRKNSQSIVLLWK